MDISGIQKVKINAEGSDLDELSDNLFYLTSKKKLSQSDKEAIHRIIEKLKVKNGRISLEYIRYILLTNSSGHRNALDLYYTQFGKERVKSHMRKIKKVLKEKGLKYEELENVIREFKEPVNDRGSLRFCSRSQTIHLI